MSIDNFVLRKYISRAFNLKGLNKIFSELDIPVDNRYHDDLDGGVRELLRLLCEKDLLGSFHSYLKEVRPNIFWDTIDWERICQSHDAQEEKTKTVFITIEAGFQGYDFEQFREVLSEFLSIPRSEVKIMEAISEGLSLTVDLPELVSNKFYADYLKNGINLDAFAIQKAVMYEANLELIDLSSLNLKQMILAGANLSGANLSNADLFEADLKGSDLFGANLPKTNLNRVNFKGAALVATNFSGANLSETDLSGANMSGANLESADLTGANLLGADLSRATLVGADLTGANIVGANLAGADLSNVIFPDTFDVEAVIYDETTQWPHGQSPIV